MLFNTAFDSLALPVYISGLESFEVVYINTEGRKLLGDITGRKCYEVLSGTGGICPGCISPEQLEQKGSSRSGTRYLAAVDKYINTYESIISLPDGSKGRLCLIVDITAQEQGRLKNEAQEKARKEMKNLIDIQSGFIRSAKSMMTAASLDGKMIFVNETMSETLGYTQDEILRMNIKDFHPPEAAKLFKEKYIPQAISEGSWKGDSYILKKDGTLLPVRQIVFPIRGDGGEVIATASIIDDITEALELERVNRYQTAILNSTDNYVGVSDLDGNTLYHSPGAYKMLGFLPGETEEWAMAKHHPDWYFEHIESEAIPAAMEKGRWTGRGEVIDRAGNHIPVEQTIFPVFDENQHPMGLATIIQNITEKVEHEKEIEAGRRTLRTIIDTAPSAIFWKDKNSRFLGANKKFAADAGVDDPEKLIGMSDYDFYPKEIADIYTASDREIFETGNELLFIEEPFKGPDGRMNWVSTSKVLIRDENNEPYALLGIYDDITKLKQNEMKLEEAIVAAKEASRAKSDFLSRMSHEIRTPMNAIIGMTKIGQTAADIEKTRYCLEKIDSSSKHLLGLINDILDMSKIEANKLELVEEPFDFEKMLENVCGVICIKTEEKEQNLLIDIGEGVPPEIEADEMRLSQVITNLLSNAVKFTPEKGTISLRVRNEGEAEDGRLRLSVSVTDTGIGLTEAQMAKLFKSFEQAEAGTSRKYGGTGLGLAISKSIVEMMGGEIGVTSKIDKGSTFSFTILVKKVKELKKKAYDISIYKGLRVLVVDDARDILDYFHRVLAGFGIRCDLTDNGPDAVELVQKGIKGNDPYQIIFVDYMMEFMDGIETTRRIKSLTGESVNVIMVSQTEWELIEGEAKNAGVDKFIPKPLFRSPILDCINQLIFNKEDLRSNKGENSNQGLEGVKMLLVEDIEINREIVLSLLEDTGVEIECAVNGEEALNIFTENQSKYDIIVMDVQMPIMDGLEATRRIKALRTPESDRIPIIAMTANAFAEDVEACKNAGMIDHIGKPIEIDTLIARIKEHLPE